MRQNFFSFRVVDSWNALPPDVVNAPPSLQAFKCKLDFTAKDEINVPIALSAFRDNGLLLLLLI